MPNASIYRAEKEPQIYHAIRFGAVLENVVIDPSTGSPDYRDIRYTENTRAAYPVEYIDNAVIPGVGGHPNHVLFLTADAFGVLPPIARLNPAQAMYHFLSGYTAKLAGTEAGLGSEPVPEFSTCFASPFIPRSPRFTRRCWANGCSQHNAQCWLVNTGWTGGAFGTGERMSLKYTRAMVNAALDGRLSQRRVRHRAGVWLEHSAQLPGRAGGVVESAQCLEGSEGLRCAGRALGKEVPGELRQVSSAGRSARRRTADQEGIAEMFLRMLRTSRLRVSRDQSS